MTLEELKGSVRGWDIGNGPYEHEWDAIMGALEELAAHRAAAKGWPASEPPPFQTLVLGETFEGGMVRPMTLWKPGKWCIYRGGDWCEAPVRWYPYPGTNTVPAQVPATTAGEGEKS